MSQTNIDDIFNTNFEEIDVTGFGDLSAPFDPPASEDDAPAPVDSSPVTRSKPKRKAAAKPEKKAAPKKAKKPAASKPAASKSAASQSTASQPVQEKSSTLMNRILSATSLHVPSCDQVDVAWVLDHVAGHEEKLGRELTTAINQQIAKQIMRKLS